jgi:hypothetical protein
MFRPKRTEPVFLETPRGLLTPEGTWFRTSVQQLTGSYPEVLARSNIDDLIHRSEVWLHSHRSIALLVVALLLFLLPPGWAVAIGCVVFLGWLLIAPSLGNRVLANLFEWLGWAPVQVFIYVVILSVFGASDRYAELLFGVAWFVAIRWRLLDLISRPVANRLFARLYSLPVPDQMLRAVIFSEAIRLGIPLEGFPSIAKWLDSDRDAKT